MKPAKFRTLVLSSVIFWALIVTVFLGMCILILKVGDALAMPRVLTEGMILAIFLWIAIVSALNQYHNVKSFNIRNSRLDLIEDELEDVLKKITPTSSYSEGMHDGVEEALNYIKQIKGDN